MPTFACRRRSRNDLGVDPYPYSEDIDAPTEYETHFSMVGRASVTS